MVLCENCLERTDKPQRVPVGHDLGSQRDPYRIERTLCEACAGALVQGEWDVLHDRYSAERRVQR